MAFDPDIQCSLVDPWFYYNVKDGEYFYLLIHDNDYTCAYSDHLYFTSRQPCRAGVRGGRETTDSYMDIALLGDVTNLLQNTQFDELHDQSTNLAQA